MSDYTFWWECESEESIHQDVFRYVRALEEAQVELYQTNLRHARLYANYDSPGLDWKSNGTKSWRRNVTAVSENVIESVVDTATSMIAKNRPRASFQTNGADWKTQRRAKGLEKYVEGMFQKAHVYDLAPRIFRDACVFGTGVLKIYIEDGEICISRVLPDELIVDELECRNGCHPRQMHQRRFVDKEVLKGMFPKMAAKIDLLRPTGEYTSFMRVPNHQMVVVESWRLPSSPGARDGMHCICIDGLTLLCEEFNDDCFPFVVYRWSEPLTGFYGKGLSAQLLGIQLRINKLNKFIDECHDLIAVPRVFMDVGGKAPKAQLTDRIGEIIPTRGGAKAVQIHVPPAVSPEIYQRLEQLKRSAYELAGISQLSASAKKPSGLESAVALREYNDIETQRFAINAQRYEAFFLEIARHIVRLAKKLHGRGSKPSVVFQSRKFAEKIEWKDVDLDEDVYSMSIEASSILSRTPAGRLQSVTELLQAGLIDVAEGKRLMGHPDLERAYDIENAAIEDIEAVIENLLDGKWEAPEGMQDLTRGLMRVQLAYLKAKRDGAPMDRLELMRRWMTNAQALLQPAVMPGSTGPMGAPPGGPMGGPLPVGNTEQPVPGMSQQAMNIAPVG